MIVEAPVSQMSSAALSVTILKRVISSGVMLGMKGVSISSREMTVDCEIIASVTSSRRAEEMSSATKNWRRASAIFDG